MKYAGYLFKKCKYCKRRWNVSTKNKDKHYVCPECERKVIKNNMPKVLLKNKSKFCI